MVSWSVDLVGCEWLLSRVNHGQAVIWLRLSAPLIVVKLLGFLVERVAHLIVRGPFVLRLFLYLLGTSWVTRTVRFPQRKWSDWRLTKAFKGESPYHVRAARYLGIQPRYSLKVEKTVVGEFWAIFLWFFDKEAAVDLATLRPPMKCRLFGKHWYITWGGTISPCCVWEYHRNRFEWTIIS